jgi:hypothetical protein
MNKIDEPKVNNEASKRLIDNMYISNVSNRLRTLNQPNDVDRKRWIWELIQNAKDTIADNHSRNTIKVRIVITGDIVKFQHDGDPFTSDTRLGLLYKYSSDKKNAESTGRFGTGFLTTHCLSKIVTIESNMYGDNKAIVGFSVTMYRDGSTEEELLDGLKKMRESEIYVDEPYEWTTYTYHVNSESGRRAIQLGKENFKENIAQTLLFCKKISSVELIDNGKEMTIERISDNSLTDSLKIAKFKIKVDDESIVRTFIYCGSETPNAELTKKYKAERSIRIQTACEVDNDNNIVSTGQGTSLFCVFPLVGIESQIQMPIIINSPDFEPDNERQSLILNGSSWNEEKDVITEVGINQQILEEIPEMFKIIIKYLSSHFYHRFFNLSNGLKTVKEHEKLDKKWYSETIVSALRAILTEFPIVNPIHTSGDSLHKLSECIIVKEKKKESEETLFSLLSSLYPDKLVADNDKWSQMLWSDDSIKLWNTEDVCKDIESKATLDSINVISNEHRVTDSYKLEWYNRFLEFISSQNELFLKEYALLTNMNGVFLKKDIKDFKQGETISSTILDMLAKLDGDMRPLLLHESITSVSLDSKFDSTSFSAKADSLAKAIIYIPSNELSDSDKLTKLTPIFSIMVSDESKYGKDFITKRSHIFKIIKELFDLSDLKEVVDNSLDKSAWNATDQWLIEQFISTIESKKTLSNLPTRLGAKWLNDAIISLEITLSEMNKVAILPNQNGTFCKAQDLFIDDGIPEELKDDVFGKIGLLYKDILLDNNINAKSFGMNRSKCVSDFAQDLSNKTKGHDYSYKTSYDSYESYRQYDEESLRQVSQYLIQILPKDKSEVIFKTQTALRDISRFFLGKKYKGKDFSINFTDNKLWESINKFVCLDIVKYIEDCGNLSDLAEQLDTSVDNLFEKLNFLYEYIGKYDNSLFERSIYPNQKGDFFKIDDLYSDNEKIDKQLKDIIELISDDKDNYYNILIDSRCSVPVPKQKTCIDAYAYIDGTIKNLYNSSDNWENENFKKAASILIERWGEENKNIFDANHFPKVFPIKDSICMNVVWTKTERDQLQGLKNNLNSEELDDLVKHIEDFKSLSTKNKELEDENKKLRDIIEKLKAGSADVTDGNDNNISKKKQYEAQLEAQRALMHQRKDWIFPDNYGECKDNGEPYNNSTVEVLNENREQMHIVVKSYKDRNAKFKINESEWTSVVQNNAKLLVYTKYNDQLDIVEVPKSDLVMNQSNISITFNAENLDNDQYSERISKFVEILHYFSGLHFDFDRFHIAENAKRVKYIYSKHNGVQTPTTIEDI